MELNASLFSGPASFKSDLLILRDLAHRTCPQALSSLLESKRSQVVKIRARRDLPQSQQYSTSEAKDIDLTALYGALPHRTILSYLRSWRAGTGLRYLPGSQIPP
jgi:hypothetical protein